MSCLIEKEADAEMKQAYTEMLEGCLMAVSYTHLDVYKRQYGY